MTSPGHSKDPASVCAYLMRRKKIIISVKYLNILKIING
jgi:hypothetical protein